MTKRILDLYASEIEGLSKQQELDSIQRGEGRTLICEVVCTYPPLLGSISNMELVCAFGADLLLLNDYDVQQPLIKGLPQGVGPDALRQLKRLTGRMVGVDLFVKDPRLAAEHPKAWPAPGNLATAENIERVIEQGADLVNLVADPVLGASNQHLLEALRTLPAGLKEQVVVIAGRMNTAGVPHWRPVELVNPDFIAELVAAGADVVMMPAPGSVAGFTVEMVRELVDHCHQLGVITLTGIGTSQEGADPATIRTLALNCKMAGTDIHHLGDSGLVSGVASPENILHYAIAIKGKRHAYRRMAMSINR